MDVVVCVGIASLEREDGRVWRCIELDNGLHGQWPVDEVRRLVIDILHLNNHALIVRVWQNRNKNRRRRKNLLQCVCVCY